MVIPFSDCSVDIWQAATAHFLLSKSESYYATKSIWIVSQKKKIDLNFDKVWFSIVHQKIKEEREKIFMRGA